MYQASLYQMSESARESMEQILEDMEVLEEVIEDQKELLAQKDQYIDELTSPRWYLDLAVVIFMSYMYGAWFGVYMCPK